MPALVFKVNNYKNETAIENLVNYILVSPYFEHYGAVGCFIAPGRGIPEQVADSFRAAKSVYFKNDGQQVQHLIIGLRDLPLLSERETGVIATAAAIYYYRQGYQVFWGIHFGSDTTSSYRHIHMAINTVNAMTGKRYSPTHDNMKDFKLFMKQQYPGVQWPYYVSESYFEEYDN